MYQKYFSPLVKYSVAYMFMPLFYSVVSAFVSVVYTLLSDLVPSLFPVYNQVLDKENYLEFTRVMSIVAAFLTVFVINLIMAINDNARYERVVKRTDALYKIREELPFYLRDVIPADAIASSVPHLIFLALSFAKYPETICASAVVSMIPLIIIYCLAQKLFINGIAVGGGKE